MLNNYVTRIAIAKLLFAAYNYMGNIEVKMRGIAIFICLNVSDIDTEVSGLFYE